MILQIIIELTASIWAFNLPIAEKINPGKKAFLQYFNILMSVLKYWRKAFFPGLIFSAMGRLKAHMEAVSSIMIWRIILERKKTLCYLKPQTRMQCMTR